MWVLYSRVFGASKYGAVLTDLVLSMQKRVAFHAAVSFASSGSCKVATVSAEMLFHVVNLHKRLSQNFENTYIQLLLHFL